LPSSNNFYNPTWEECGLMPASALAVVELEVRRTLVGKEGERERGR
jgi:hypothetical protein